jgi:ATP-GRASP peptide maturase of grasp-with-spasm system
MEKQGRIITKCIADGIFYSLDDYDFSMYTQEVTESMIVAIPEDLLYPSLFQQMLEKKYELRIFYLDGICYPMAIFSQNDKQTKVDFRHYNVQKPNRNVPYQLPSEIETGIVKLMESLELRCGSIDMVRTIDGQYVFLEVNPIGQFGMVSGPCNYYLEKEMAKYLIKHDR